VTDAERDVIEKAKNWERQHGQLFVAKLDESEVELFNAVNRLKEQLPSIDEK